MINTVNTIDRIHSIENAVINVSTEDLVNAVTEAVFAFQDFDNEFTPADAVDILTGLDTSGDGYLDSVAAVIVSLASGIVIRDDGYDPWTISWGDASFADVISVIMSMKDHRAMNLYTNVIIINEGRKMSIRWYMEDILDSRPPRIENGIVDQDTINTIFEQEIFA